MSTNILGSISATAIPHRVRGLSLRDRMILANYALDCKGLLVLDSMQIGMFPAKKSTEKTELKVIFLFR